MWKLQLNKDGCVWASSAAFSTEAGELMQAMDVPQERDAADGTVF